MPTGPALGEDVLDDVGPHPRPLLLAGLAVAPGHALRDPRHLPLLQAPPHLQVPDTRHNTSYRAVWTLLLVATLLGRR